MLSSYFLTLTWSGTVNKHDAGTSKTQRAKYKPEQDPQDEAKLLERCRNGDQAAFESLVKAHYQKAIRVAYGVVHSREDALDIAQSAFLKVFRNLKRFSGRSSFSTWLYRIVWNEAVDWQRKAVRKSTISLDSDSDSERRAIRETLPGRFQNPRQEAFESEIQQRLQQSIEGLPEEHRQTIVLRELEGLSYKQIAEVSGVRVGTVMSRLHYARMNIKSDMEEWLGQADKRENKSQ